METAVNCFDGAFRSVQYDIQKILHPDHLQGNGRCGGRVSHNDHLDARGDVGDSPSAGLQKRAIGIANASIEERGAGDIDRREVYPEEHWYAQTSGKRRRLDRRGLDGPAPTANGSVGGGKTSLVCRVLSGKGNAMGSKRSFLPAYTKCAVEISLPSGLAGAKHAEHSPTLVMPEEQCFAKAGGKRRRLRGNGNEHRVTVLGMPGTCDIRRQRKSFADGSLCLVAECSLNTQESLQAKIKAGVGDDAHTPPGSAKTKGAQSSSSQCVDISQVAFSPSSMSPSRRRNAARKNAKKAEKSLAAAQKGAGLQNGEKSVLASMADVNRFVVNGLLPIEGESQSMGAERAESAISKPVPDLQQLPLIQRPRNFPMAVKGSNPGMSMRVEHAGSPTALYPLRIVRKHELAAQTHRIDLLARVTARSVSAQGRGGVASISKSESQYRAFLVWQTSDARSTSKSPETGKERYRRFLAWQSGVE
jgi:hypothetical protein